MITWAIAPKPWTLPVAGAIVGYATNWVAIKLLFDPVEPVQVGPIVVQGLFESRQVEVSDEFGTFMSMRVLNSKTPMFRRSVVAVRASQFKRVLRLWI